MSKPRYIVHIDMDAFFASVEQRDQPLYKNKPVIIGSNPKQGHGRGVVSTCSYEARRFGIHSAMAISKAYFLCPNGIFLRPNMKKYAKASNELFELLGNFTPKVEPISIDEAFLDITGSCHLFGGPQKTCLAIQERIKKDFRLTASVGLAPTLMAAKIASDLNKPEGFTEVAQDGVVEFLAPLDISKLWGVGPKTKNILNGLGIKAIGDLVAYDEDKIIKKLGNSGYHLICLARGVDTRSVEGGDEIKSVSNETTFEYDLGDESKIEGALAYLSDKVSCRLRKLNIMGKTISLKIRLDNFKTYTRARTLENPTNFLDIIFKTIKSLYNDFNRDGRAVRLVGVKVSNFFEHDDSIDLFNFDKVKKMGRRQIALDKIKDRFGSEAISIGAKLQ